MFKNKLSFLIFLIFFLVPTKIFASDYEITKYNIKIEMAENNVMHIHENITAKFNTARHGIFRKIPIYNYLGRTDGTHGGSLAEITDIKVSDVSTTYNQGSYKVIKIGDANRTITGLKEYNIEYRYNIGKDLNDNYDEFYFNIIGTEWDTTISNVSFTVSLPKPFNSHETIFSVGELGSINSSNIDYETSGQKIYGQYLGTLKAGQGITARIQLPEGYIVNAKDFEMEYIRNVLMIPVIFIIIAIIIWVLRGVDGITIAPVQFYPPKNFNSVEVAFLYKGTVSNNDILSLIVYLGNKGYLKIAEMDDPPTHSFKLTKLKEYDGNDEIERMFFNTLFARENIITRLNISDDYIEAFERIKTEFMNEEKINMIFTPGSFMRRYVIFLMAFVSLGILFIQTAMLNIQIFDVSNGVTIVKSLLKLFLPLTVNFNYILGYILGLICTSMLLVIGFVAPKRTNYGAKILGEIQGFRNFLETAEKEKFEQLVMENPQYFYEILPYIYVLNISNKWIEKFEILVEQRLEWYEGEYSSEIFNTYEWNKKINYSLFSKYIENERTSEVQSTSSFYSDLSNSGSGGFFGGSSGGGFSGGGSGGGGGGSW